MVTGRRLLFYSPFSFFVHLEVIPLNRTGLLRADFKPIRLVDFRRTYLGEYSELSDKSDI